MANAFIPAEIAEGGNGFPAVSQTRVKGGAWSVSAIADWQSEIEARYRAAGMRILDRSDRSEWVLQDDLVSVVETKGSAASADAEQSASNAAQFAQTADERATAAGVSETNSAVSETNSANSASASESFKDQSSASHSATLAAQTTTEQARDQVLAAVQFNAFRKVYQTLEAFSADNTTVWAEDDVVLVLSDSSQFGAPTGYVYDGTGFSDPVALTGPGQLAVLAALQQSGVPRGLPRVAKKLYDVTRGETTEPLIIVPQIDSVAGAPHWIGAPEWDAFCRPDMPQPEKLGDHTGQPYPSSFFDTLNTPVSGTRQLVTDLTVWYMQSANAIQEYTDGEFLNRSGGAKPTMDEIHKFYIVRADGGSFRITVDGIEVDDWVDTSVGTPGELKHYVYTPPARLTNSNECRFLVTGTVQFGTRFFVNYDDKIQYYGNLAEGGLNLEDAFEHQQARDNYRFLLNEISPDWITWCARESERPAGYTDDPEDDPTPWISTYMPMLFSIWKGLDTPPDVTVFSGWPMTSESSNNSVLRGSVVLRRLVADAAAEGYSYDFVDDFTVWMPDGKEATARAFAEKIVAMGADISDEATFVHPGKYGPHALLPATKAYMAMIFGGPLGGQPRAPWCNSPATVGDLRIVPKTGSGVANLQWSINSNGYEATGYYYNRFQMIDRYGTVHVQFGNGSNSFPNMLPMDGTVLDGLDSGREINYHRVGTTSTYLWNIDDDNDAFLGRMGCYVGAVKMATIDLSDIPSGWLTGMAGGLVYGTDGTFRFIAGGNAWHAAQHMPLANAVGASKLGLFATSDEELRVADSAGGWLSIKKASAINNVAPITAGFAFTAGPSYDQTQIQILADEIDDMKSALRDTQLTLNSALSAFKTAGSMKTS